MQTILETDRTRHQKSLTTSNLAQASQLFKIDLKKTQQKYNFKVPELIIMHEYAYLVVHLKCPC